MVWFCLMFILCCMITTEGWICYAVKQASDGSEESISTREWYFETIRVGWLDPKTRPCKPFSKGNQWLSWIHNCLCQNQQS